MHVLSRGCVGKPPLMVFDEVQQLMEKDVFEFVVIKEYIYQQLVSCGMRVPCASPR